IAEMRLVYLYKAYEIMLKEIIKSAYAEEVNLQSDLQALTKLLQEKNIRIKKIPGFTELEELRIIVNNIKHRTVLNPKAKAMQEFQGCNEITYNAGTAFYQRVSPAVNTYMEKLSERIFKSCIKDHDRRQ